MCFADIEIKNFTYHLEQDHSIKVDSKSLKFGSIEEFQKWQTAVEVETKANFIRQRTPDVSKDGIVTQYCCNRSGHFKSRSRNIRHPKLKGSVKINGFCPAGIKVVEKNGVCDVLFTYTHVGHQQKLGHLYISKHDKESLAQKIAASIPFESILNEVRDSIAGNQLNRIHLLTKKDLFNIEQSYNLNGKTIKDKNDAISVESWVDQLGESVLFYKAQDTQSPMHPNLKTEDFFLIIMTEGQKEMLEKYGMDCICIDGTHGLNGYGFELHTLLVIDQMREGFPAAFLISNRADELALNIFYSHIKEELGKQLQPSVFMSDMASTYYNAWLQVMLPADFRYV